MDHCLEAHLFDLEQLQTALGVSLGYAHARAGKESKVKSAMRSLRKRAHPHQRIILDG